jgi:hypothetical protein
LRAPGGVVTSVAAQRELPGEGAHTRLLTGVFRLHAVGADYVRTQSCTATRPRVADGGGARPKSVELNDYPSASLPTLYDATVADLHTLRVSPSLSQRHLQWAASPPPQTSRSHSVPRPSSVRQSAARLRRDILVYQCL